MAPAIGVLVAIIAAAVIFGGLSGANQTENRTTDSSIQQYLVREAVKPVTVRSETGSGVTLDSTLPDKTLITFWDATCAECRTGLPVIVAFIAAHPEVRPIYINHQNTIEQAKAALAEMNLAIETLYDTDGSAFSALSGTMPATYFIRNGEFRVFFPGRPSAEQLSALLTVN